MMIPNCTSILKRRINVLVEGKPVEARVQRIGAPQLSGVRKGDPRLWSIVYATLANGNVVTFAAINDGIPTWMASW